MGHAMFFHQELPNAPNHERLRQQRWNKRRIQRRWNWKKGRERQKYEKAAAFLKNLWIEMDKDCKASNDGTLSNDFLIKNEKKLSFQFDKDEDDEANDKVM